MEHTEKAKKGLMFNVQWALSTLAVFLVTTLSLGGLGLTPEPISANADSAAEDSPVAFIGDATPSRIIIDAIGVDASIANPSSNTVSALDAALLSGAARYPGSADLAGAGNMFIFGHSTSHTVVYNPSYKTFNTLSNLVAGDIIKVRSSTDENQYRVTKVTFAKDSAITVPLGGTKKMLTISTCNSFGEKSDRIVVEAEYIGTYPLPFNS